MAIPFRRTAVVMLSIWALSLALTPRMAFAWPTSQTAAITYQGLLKSGGAAINGSVDLQFKLFDAAAAGNQIGSTLAANSVVVADGVFTSSLDFGALAFNGEERWLEISVASPAGGGIGPFTTLAPRQPLASAPYAAFALNALLPATYAGAVNFTNPANAFRGNGANLTSLNASNIGTGTLADARLSSNVGTLASTQTITGAKTFSTSPSFTSAAAPFTVTSTALVGNLNADLLDGLSSAAFLQAIPVPLTLSGANAGAHIIQGVNTSAAVDATGVHGAATGLGFVTYGVRGAATSTIGRGVFGEATATTGQSYGVYGTSASTGGRGVFGTATAATGVTAGGKFESQSTTGVGAVGGAYATSGVTSGVWGEAASGSGRGVYGVNLAVAGTAAGGRFETGSTGGVGVWGISNATSGFNWGVIGYDSSTSGTGVLGRAFATTGDAWGVYGISESTSGNGVHGYANTSTGFNYGGYFESDSVDGRGVFGIANATSGDTYGGRFQTPSTTGRGVLGWATSASGDNYGVQGQSASPTGLGVYGVNTATSGQARGVFGRSSSTVGYGVYGESVDNIGTAGYATALTGFNYGVYGESSSSSGRGVFGRATSGSGTIYGVYGQASTTASGFAVYANGDLGASGLKPFRIDHPDDPANRYLLHYAAESPEVINFYSGKVTLNGAGEAIVELPLYFAKINKDPRYTLTAIGAAMPNLHIAEEIDENALALGARAEPSELAMPCWFRIAGGMPGMKVSWEVKAVRNDRYVQRHGAPVEVVKRDLERGTYQHPELYDQPANVGLGYMPEDVAQPRALAVDDAADAPPARSNGPNPEPEGLTSVRERPR